VVYVGKRSTIVAVGRLFSAATATFWQVCMFATPTLTHSLTHSLTQLIHFHYSYPCIEWLSMWWILAAVVTTLVLLIKWARSTGKDQPVEVRTHSLTQCYSLTHSMC
jgi:hypothetical protein